MINQKDQLLVLKFKANNSCNRNKNYELRVLIKKCKIDAMLTF